MGVVTEFDIDYGKIFGPFPVIDNVEPAYYIGLLTSDQPQDKHTIKIDLRDLPSDPVSPSWLPYVLPARNEEEQNMEAYLKDGRIFYRTLCIIRAGQELLVWYSKDFAQILELTTPKRREPDCDEICSFTCPRCTETFKFPFTLSAHRKFRCSNQVSGNQKDRALNNNNNVSPFHEIPVDEQTSTRKRSSDDKLDNSPSKRICADSPGSQKKQVKDIRHIADEADDKLSAFRKVEKGAGTEVDSMDMPLLNQNPYSYARKSVHEMHLPETTIQNLYQKSYLPVNPFDNRQRGGLSMFLSNWMVPHGNGRQPFVDKRPFEEQLTFDSSKIGLFNQELAPTGRAFENSSALGKHVLFNEIRRAPFSYVKISNPMVEKILTGTNPATVQSPLTALNLSQNWCAKCNATFRMTSDLVYHMRSHHKREFDPVKKKRDDKLQCNVCQETFKERHHLTRHMSSHV